MLKIKLPAFIRDAVVESGTNRIAKDIRKGKLKAILDYAQRDSGAHFYKFELQSAGRAAPILSCHAEGQNFEDCDEIPLMPEMVGEGVLHEMGYKTGTLVGQGDELVILLSHRFTEEDRHIFRVKFKPPLSQVIYLEFGTEGDGSGIFEMSIAD